MLVKFYTPKCPFCQALHPIFEELANTTNDFQVGEVNCKQFAKICEDQDVPHYPYVRYFSDNYTYTFKGNRSVPSFMSFVSEITKPDEFTTVEACHQQAIDAVKDQYFVYHTRTLDNKEYLKRFRTLTKICYIEGNERLIAHRDGQIIEFDEQLDNQSQVLVFMVVNKNSFLKELTADNFAKATLDKLVILIINEDDYKISRQLAFNLHNLNDQFFKIYKMERRGRDKFLKQYGITGESAVLLALDPERQDVFWKSDVKNVVKDVEKIIEQVITGEDGEEKDEL